MNFTGNLNQNQIFGALYNMIISQQVYADNIKGTNSKLVENARVDGGLFGDQKLYYATDVLKSYDWQNDNEAGNLLAINRPNAPEVQAIVLNKFRQINITVDNYLTKQAFKDEGAFGSFNSVILGWISETKKIYDSTTYNAYIGTTTSSVQSDIEANITEAVGDKTGEEANRLEGMAIAETLANLFTDMQDISTDYNDYGFLRSYDLQDLRVVWNSKFVNKIRKIDLPTIFHNDGLVDKFGEFILPEKYFGNVNESATQGNGTTVRSLIEQTIGNNHYFAGQLIKTGDTAPAGTSYTNDNTIICKIMHKNSVPFMSAFMVGTEFFNPRSLTENHYLTWGHNTIEYLKNYPFFNVKKA